MLKSTYIIQQGTKENFYCKTYEININSMRMLCNIRSEKIQFDIIGNLEYPANVSHIK